MVNKLSVKINYFLFYIKSTETYYFVHNRKKKKKSFIHDVIVVELDLINVIEKYIYKI